MAFSDLFRSRKSNKLNALVWQAVWSHVQETPADTGQRERYLVYVGTLLYAVRFQASLAAGMEETIARSVAMHVVGQAGYGAAQEDAILSVFSASPDNPTSTYATELNGLLSRLAGFAMRGEALSAEGEPGEILTKIKDLKPLLSKQLKASPGGG